MKTLIVIAIFSLSLLAQERVLLRIGESGQQEAIPLKKGEKVADALRRINDEPPRTFTSGTLDTIKYYDPMIDFPIAFAFYRGDVALQWYKTDAACIVKEFWWRSGEKIGATGKANVRLWQVNPKLTKTPWPGFSHYIGTYRDPNADDGVTPYPPVSGNTWFYCSSLVDSPLTCFPPLLREKVLNTNGTEIQLVSNQWQRIIFDDLIDSVKFEPFEPFGFTIENPDDDLGESKFDWNERVPLTEVLSYGQDFTCRSGMACSG
jgi:hypothetical protein